MKRILTALMLFGLISIFSVDMDAQKFSNGDLVINANLGLNSGTNLIGTVDYGIAAENISVGAGLWHQTISFLGISASATSLLGRVAYHFGEAVNVEKLDLYGGGELAIGLNGGGTNLALLPGARYYFNEKLAGHAELPIYLGNGGGSYFRIGVSFKLN